MEFSQALIDARLDIQWSMPSGTRSEALDGEALALMKAAAAARSGTRESGPRRSPAHQEARQAAADARLMRAAVLDGDALPPDSGCRTRRSATCSVAGIATRVARPVHDTAATRSPVPGSELHGSAAEGRIDPEAEDYDQTWPGTRPPTAARVPDRAERVDEHGGDRVGIPARSAIAVERRARIAVAARPEHRPEPEAHVPRGISDQEPRLRPPDRTAEHGRPRARDRGLRLIAHVALVRALYLTSAHTFSAISSTRRWAWRTSRPPSRARVMQSPWSIRSGSRRTGVISSPTRGWWRTA